MSGGDLKGKANRYGLSYKTSRNKVFGLLHDAGIYFLHTTGQNGLREVFEVGIPIPKDCRINGLTKDDMNILRKSVIENNPSILFLGEYSSKTSQNIFKMFLEDFETAKHMIKG